jgi:hypothetical protein
MVIVPARQRGWRTLRLVLVGAMALMIFNAWTSFLPAGSRQQAPLVGFSFSPKLARWTGHEPIQTLRTLLREVQPGLVRLPIYWDSVAPTREDLDFTEFDQLLGVVAEHNREDPIDTVRVVLVVGARNLGSPELHAPDWLGKKGRLNLARELRLTSYVDYLEATVRRYSSSPLLYAWQMENEPLDSTNPELGDIAVPAEMVAEEVRLTHRLDPVHAVVVTTFNSSNIALDGLGSMFQTYSPWKLSSGHPRPTLQLGDVLGLNAYVVTPNAPGRISVARRIAWKRDALRYWADQARSQGKRVWITEMQAAPWKGVKGFTPADLQKSAELYRDTGVSVVFLWGAEEWLRSSSWLTAARQATKTLERPGLQA